MNRIDSVIALSLGVQAQTVRVNGLACLVQNNSDTTVYIKEKRDDGQDVTAGNGWALAAGKETSVPLVARELSLAALAEGADVRVLVLEQE